VIGGRNVDSTNENGGVHSGCDGIESVMIAATRDGSRKKDT
jgi:hypothetical protein